MESDGWAKEPKNSYFKDLIEQFMQLDLLFLVEGLSRKVRGKKKNRERWKVEGRPKSEWVLTVLLQEPTKGDFSEFRLAMLVLVMSKLNAFKT